MSQRKMTSTFREQDTCYLMDLYGIDANYRRNAFHELLMFDDNGHINISLVHLFVAFPLDRSTLISMKTNYN